jgi:hypothetical protein
MNNWGGRKSILAERDICSVIKMQGSHCPQGYLKTESLDGAQEAMVGDKI